MLQHQSSFSPSESGRIDRCCLPVGALQNFSKFFYQLRYAITPAPSLTYPQSISLPNQRPHTDILRLFTTQSLSWSTRDYLPDDGILWKMESQCPTWLSVCLLSAMRAVMWSRSLLVLIVSVCLAHGGIYHDDPGPWVVPTQGEPWPKPAERFLRDGFKLFRPSIFQIEVDEECDILMDAKHRYMSIIINEARVGLKALQGQPPQMFRTHPDYRGTINSLPVRVVQPCERVPYLHMNELYHLEIVDSGAYLYANTVWGALRGLETFSQLLIPTDDGCLMVKEQIIIDRPNLPHRGLLLDTSRHFFPLEDIFSTLDAMSYNKLNVFHWHIVDDNSFPYVSSAFPELSQKGAWHPTFVYTPDDVRKVIQYARVRGIRVMPEFDSPGHVASWGLSHPDLLTACYDSTGKLNGRMGPVNPINPGVWPFMRTLLSEVMSIFTDHYLHLGGDEVPFDCWQSNPFINEYMKENGMESDYRRLENSYITELLKIPTSLNVSSIFWQEVFENGVQLPSEAVVHVWTGKWDEIMSEATQAGHPVLLSACWYLDHLASGGDWTKFYLCDPLDFEGASSVKHLVLGGEACMWTEFVDRNNVHSRIWPRASAAAERLWSPGVDSITGATRRLEEHTCRMNRRNIAAQPPNGPDFCIV